MTRRPTRPPRWLQAARSALFNLAMYGASAIICVLLLPLLLGPMSWGQRAGGIWSGAILFLLKIICGLDHRVLGREHLPKGACIIAPKQHSLTAALAAASRGIEKVCNRQFNVASSATARIFYPVSSYVVKVDDFSTTTSLAIATDEGNDGTYETIWTTSDYQLEPLNGVVDGETGWPYWRIRAVGSKAFRCVGVNYRAPLQVTATWGWSAVPTPVKEGCRILAEEIYKLKDSPFGVGGYGQFGIIRARENPMVWARVGPYAYMPGRRSQAERGPQLRGARSTRSSARSR